jgi:hypothetical protein
VTSICFPHCPRQLPVASRADTYVQRHKQTQTLGEQATNDGVPTPSGVECDKLAHHSSTKSMFRGYEWQVTLLASLYICGSSIPRFRVSEADEVTAPPFSNILLRLKTSRHCTAKFKRHPLARHS